MDGRAFISSIQSEDAVKDVQNVMKKTDEKNICSRRVEVINVHQKPRKKRCEEARKDKEAICLNFLVKYSFLAKELKTMQKWRKSGREDDYKYD